MSHTFTAASGNEYFLNDDFTGDVRLLSSDEIPFEDILELAGEYVRFQRMEYAEAYKALNMGDV